MTTRASAEPATAFRAVVLASTLACACRYVGPDGSPTTLIEVDASLPEEEIEAGAGPEEGRELLADARSSERETSDARPSSVDATAPDGATADGATAARDAATSERRDAATASCAPPPDLACDPVSGEGCLPLMQCLVDPSSTDPAAYCVFSGIQLDVVCTQDGILTDCPAQHTCVMGECRKYCYCDAHCEDGAACRQPSGEGSPRFRLCEQTSG